MSLRGAQRRGNPFSLQHSITESSTLGEYEKILRIRPKAHLSLPFPAGMRIATPVCALVRNDMQKTGTRQRMQGGGTRGKVRRRWQFCLVQRPCLCGHAACFCMSLRGAQRRGNPFSLQYSIAESSTSGEYAAVYKFAQKRIYRCLSLRGRGLPQVCALVRNDIQKTDTRQRM